MVPLAPETIALGTQQQRTALIGSEPVAQAYADPAHAFDSPNPSRELWTEQAGISCFVGYTPDCRQAEVDGCWSEMSLLQVDSVSKNNRAIESESRFRTVPIDEFVYCMIVRSLTALRSQAVQYGRLRLFEIG